MPRWLVIGLAVAGLVAAAVVERLTSNPASGDARSAAAKLAAVPPAFGDWTSIEAPLADKVLKVAEATGNVSRTYTNASRKNSSSVGVLLLCGPSGPIGAHTPEACYAGSGYAMIGDPQKVTVALPDGTATYWSARFEKKPPATEPPLRVCWTWGTDGDWRASENPRADFASHRALYKLYVVRHEPRTPDALLPNAAPDAIQEFLTAFLPEVKKAFAAPAGQ